MAFTLSQKGLEVLSGKLRMCVDASSTRAAGANERQSWSNCACGLLAAHGSCGNSKLDQISLIVP